MVCRVKTSTVQTSQFTLKFPPQHKMDGNGEPLWHQVDVISIWLGWQGRKEEVREWALLKTWSLKNLSSHRKTKSNRKVSNGSCDTRKNSRWGFQRRVFWAAETFANLAARQEIIKDWDSEASNLLHFLLEPRSWVSLTRCWLLNYFLYFEPSSIVRKFSLRNFMRDDAATSVCINV